jgi:hypothetical protein
VDSSVNSTYTLTVTTYRPIMPFPTRLPHPKWPSRWLVPRYISAIPLPAAQLIGLLILVNGLVWVAAGILLRMTPLTPSPISQPHLNYLIPN